MSKIISLFKDDGLSGNERKHHAWLTSIYFKEPEYIVYPNVALHVIINSDSPAVKKELSPDATFIDSLDRQWCPQNFFDTSSVDLCVINKGNYLPLVAFEVDGRSHLKESQRNGMG
jgi:hypothetical protein